MKTKDLFGFNVGDDLYIASKDKNKVCRFFTDCIKVFDNNITVHGYVYGLYGKYGIPIEYSLKNLNKRIIFTKKQDELKWLKTKSEK